MPNKTNQRKLELEKIEENGLNLEIPGIGKNASSSDPKVGGSMCTDPQSEITDCSQILSRLDKVGCSR